MALGFVLTIFLIILAYQIYLPDYSMEGEGYLTFMHCSASGLGHYIYLTDESGNKEEFLLDHATFSHKDIDRYDGEYVRISEGREGLREWGYVQEITRINQRQARLKEGC